MELAKYLKEKKDYIDNLLKQNLLSTDSYPNIIHKSMHYSIFAGGKRIRPILCLAACEAVGGNIEEATEIACSLEMIHTYSLIHDDLPAMDDDDFRRGLPTNHKVFGDGIAVLAGDALLTYAFQLLMENGLNNPTKTREILKISQEIAKSSGVQGMIGGQVADLISEGKDIDLEVLDYIHKHKTSALIEVSIRSGAIIGGATQEQLENLSLYAENLGLVFQITDDLLDILGNAEKLGKPIGSDEKNHKKTYPDILGIDESRKIAEEKVSEALNYLKSFDNKADPLRNIAKYLLIREN